MSRANSLNRALLISCLVSAAVAAAGCGRQLEIKTAPRARTPKPVSAKSGAAKARSARLTVTVIDSATTQKIPAVPVGIGTKYLTTDASGVAMANLRTGDITVTARAPGRLIYEAGHRLEAGENTVTVALAPETEAVEKDTLVYRRQAYLTIDDGPSAIWTPKVLDILKRAKVPATFFLVGWRAERRPQLVRRIYLEGHAIGNHTYSHDYDDLYGGRSRDLLASLAKNGRLLEEIIGFEPMLTRPPGGAAGNFRPGWQSAVTGAGYTTILWNVSTGDGSTQTTGPQMVVNTKRYLDRLKSPARAVILMHDIRPPIIEALPEIIAEVRRRGYEFSVLHEDLREPGLILGSWRPSRRF